MPAKTLTATPVDAAASGLTTPFATPATPGPGTGHDWIQTLGTSPYTESDGLILPFTLAAVTGRGTNLGATAYAVDRGLVPPWVPPGIPGRGIPGSVY